MKDMIEAMNMIGVLMIFLKWNLWIGLSAANRPGAESERMAKHVATAIALVSAFLRMALPPLQI